MMLASLPRDLVYAHQTAEEFERRDRRVGEWAVDLVRIDLGGVVGLLILCSNRLANLSEEHAWAFIHKIISWFLKQAKESLRITLLEQDNRTLLSEMMKPFLHGNAKENAEQFRYLDIYLEIPIANYAFQRLEHEKLDQGIWWRLLFQNVQIFALDEMN